jgi:hypothetical protein
MKIINSFMTPRLFCIATLTILALFAFHCLLAIGAHFTFDLGVNPINRAYEWWYPIAENPGYIGTGLHLDFVVLILLLVTPVLLVGCGLLIALTLWKRRGQMQRVQQIIGMIALAVALVMFPLLSSPFGYAVGLWWFD